MLLSLQNLWSAKPRAEQPESTRLFVLIGRACAGNNVV